MTAMKYPYCELFDFDQEAMNTRLQLLDLGEQELDLSQRFHEKILQPRLSQVIDEFYTALTAKPDFNQIMQQGGYDLAYLKQTQADYLDKLGLGFNTLAYFEERLKIGWIHLRVGVPLSLYQSSYRILQEIFIRHVCISVKDNEERQAFTNYILRISNLDMSLAISSYHHTEVDDLENTLKEYQSEHVDLIRKVSTDALTSLPTREVLTRQINNELSRLRQREGSIHLIMADLDFFKKVNDQYGHLTGDGVLKGVAARIRQSLRGTDMVGRYGGEEFIILLINKSEQQAEKIAERIRAHIAASPINANNNKIEITLSQGMAMATADDSVESLIEKADRALYDAKANGRNCVVIARG